MSSARKASRLAPAQVIPEDIMEPMTSWRDSASHQAQGDLVSLLNMTLPFAQQMLGKLGEFYPFGATVATDGEARLIAGELGQEHPASADVLSLIVERLRQDRSGLRAVAFCSAVRLRDSDAVRVELEHQDGQAMAVLMPYKRKRFGRGVEYDELRGGTADRQVWT
jgi:hypothetical protein